MRAILVDDAPVVRQMLRHALAAQPGAEVVGEASSVEDARTLLRTTPADLMILDLHLSDGTGADVLDALRPMESPPVALVFTNHALPVVRARCLSAGAAQVFDKSRELDALIEAMAVVARHTPTSQASAA
jgi:DNA-binding NarL/FixJ family response regulator